MYITDNNGNIWAVLAQVWDGDKWVVLPERIMKDGYWWLINYIRSMLTIGIKYSLNLDNTVSIAMHTSEITIFPPEDPIPI